MNKYLWSTMLSLIICFSTKAQNTDIQIKVLSTSEKEPLMGATVYFKILDKGSVTNFDGVAFFSDIPNGVYQVVISFIGFETFETTINVPSDKDLIFKLNESEDELDAVILQSTRSTRTVKKYPHELNL